VAGNKTIAMQLHAQAPSVLFPLEDGAQRCGLPPKAFTSGAPGAKARGASVWLKMLSAQTSSI